MGAAPAAATIASSAPVDEAQSVVVLEKDIWCRCWRCCQPEHGPRVDTTALATTRLPSSRTARRHHRYDMMILTMIIITLIVVATLLNRSTTSGPCAGEYPVE